MFNGRNVIIDQIYATSKFVHMKDNENIDKPLLFNRKSRSLPLKPMLSVSQILMFWKRRSQDLISSTSGCLISDTTGDLGGRPQWMPPRQNYWRSREKLIKCDFL